MVSYFTPGQTDISKFSAYMYALGMILCLIVPLFNFHPYCFYTNIMELKIKIGLRGLLYRKSMRLSKSTVGEGVSGQLLNLMTNDVAKLDFFIWGHNLWGGPLDTILCGYYMYHEVGIAAMVGLGFILSLMPIQGCYFK